MANVISVVAVAVDGQATTETHGLTVSKIIKIRPASANDIAAFPTAVTRIFYEDRKNSYQKNAKQKYLTATAVAAVITACNA